MSIFVRNESLFFPDICFFWSAGICVFWTKNSEWESTPYEIVPSCSFWLYFLSSLLFDPPTYLWSRPETSIWGTLMGQFSHEFLLFLWKQEWWTTTRCMYVSILQSLSSSFIPHTEYRCSPHLAVTDTSCCRWGCILSWEWCEQEDEMPTRSFFSVETRTVSVCNIFLSHVENDLEWCFCHEKSISPLLI
jgi:hypothetical protein